MERIEIEIDEETLARARKLAEVRRCSLDELVKEFIRQETKPAGSIDTMLGMFADEPALLDEVVESAMQARERDPLRHTVG
ncbi:MAG: hypothetical protein HY699_10400 [Deltaproteobacteria bacterium]|nr:hypothetical protein [Deltaproteobacteria bacterium]